MAGTRTGAISPARHPLPPRPSAPRTSPRHAPSRCTRCPAPRDGARTTRTALAHDAISAADAWAPDHSAAPVRAQICVRRDAYLQVTTIPAAHDQMLAQVMQIRILL